VLTTLLQAGVLFRCCLGQVCPVPLFAKEGQLPPLQRGIEGDFDACIVCRRTACVITSVLCIPVYVFPEKPSCLRFCLPKRKAGRTIFAQTPDLHRGPHW